MRVGFLCECFDLRWLVDLVVLGFRWFVAIYILQVPQDWLWWFLGLVVGSGGFVA